VKIAIGLGATLFEKHTGVVTEKYAINGYSATPDQVRKWLQSASDALTISASATNAIPLRRARRRRCAIWLAARL